jgi:hypothetical protein
MSLETPEDDSPVGTSRVEEQSLHRELGKKTGGRAMSDPTKKTSLSVAASGNVAEGRKTAPLRRLPPISTPLGPSRRVTSTKHGV